MMWLLSLIPGLLKPILDYFTARQNAQVQMYMAKTGADKDTAVAALQATTSIQNKWWFVALLQPLMAAPFVAYTWQVVLYDKMISVWLTGHTHDTDPLTSTVGWVYTVVVSSIFVHGIVDNVLRKK